MKTNIKFGLGLSLGAMVVALATINAIEDHNEKKLDAKVRIAEIEAGARPKTPRPQTRKNTNKKGNNKK